MDLHDADNRSKLKTMLNKKINYFKKKLKLQGKLKPGALITKMNAERAKPVTKKKLPKATLPFIKK